MPYTGIQWCGNERVFPPEKKLQICCSNVQTECQLLRASDFLFHSHLKNFFIFIYLKTTKICLYETFSEGAGTGILCRSNDGRHVDSVVMNTGYLSAGAPQMSDICLITA